MKIERNDILKIKLKGDDAKDFKSAMNKIVNDSERAGFNKICFSDEEKKVIKNISDKL